MTRSQLARSPREVLHHARNRTKADVYLIEWPAGSGTQVVVKDMSRQPLWFRLLIARFLMAREWAALKALEGVSGVPKPIARPDIDSIVMEKAEGSTFSVVGNESLEASDADALERLMDEVHARGVTHGDLHSNNVLHVGRGAVAIIDWATASVFSMPPRGLKFWTHREWYALDRRAVAKIRASVAPESMTAEHKKALEQPTPIARTIRKYGDMIKPGKRKRRKSSE